MTSSWPEIRAALVTAVKAVAPSSRPDVRFSYFEGDQDFTTWADSNSARAFRHFDVENRFADEFPGTANHDVELVRGQHAVRVAYPLRYAYGRQPVVRIDDVIDSDRFLIDTAIGHRASLSGFAAVFLASGVERTEAVVFSTSIYIHEYWRIV